MMRIGLFGGTFNPIHSGHLQAAAAVRTACALDIVFVIPSAVPPHKDDAGIADSRDRLAMALLATADLEGFMVSDIELRRSGPSYTVDTVTQFQDVLPPDTALFFILGADAFLEIDTWKHYHQLFDLVSMIVMVRPGIAGADIDEQKTQIGRYLTSRISSSYVPATDGGGGFEHPHKPPVLVLDRCRVDASATDIRRRLRHRQPVEDLVPPAVCAYIIRRGLYR